MWECKWGLQLRVSEFPPCSLNVMVLVGCRRCPIYQTQSQNVAPKGECTNPVYNNPADCVENTGQWVEVPSWGSSPPACVESCWSRDNHLGNTLGVYVCLLKQLCPRFWLVSHSILFVCVYVYVCLCFFVFVCVLCVCFWVVCSPPAVLWCSFHTGLPLTI